MSAMALLIYGLKPSVWNGVRSDQQAEFQFNTALGPWIFGTGCIDLSELLEIHSFLLYIANDEQSLIWGVLTCQIGIHGI